MDRLSDAAIEIINTLHMERIDYNSEYLPLIDAVNRLSAYEDIELEPNEIEQQLMNFSSFLSEMTHSHMSKTNYTVEAMVAEANDCFERVCDECADREELVDFKKLGSIDHLRDLVQAEEDGRLVVLPCKVGSIVWYVTSALEICEAEVIGIWLNLYTNPMIWMEIRYTQSEIGVCEYKSRIDLMLGKNTFLTRDEAEKALKGCDEQ